MSASTRALDALLRPLRLLVDLVGMVALAAVATVAALQFPHPPQWDSARAIVSLKAGLAPLLSALGSPLDLRWPPNSLAARFLPVVLMFAVLALRAGFHALADRIQSGARQAEARARAEEATARARAIRAASGPGSMPPMGGPPRPPVMAGGAAPELSLDAFRPAAPAPTVVPVGVPTLAAGSRAPEATEVPPPVEPTLNELPPERDLMDALEDESTLVTPPTVAGSHRGTSPGTKGTSPGTKGTSPGVRGGAPAAAGANASPRMGRYELLAELGRGAMGVVYKGWDPNIGRMVALKTVLTGNLSGRDLVAFKQRFRRETEVAGRMLHPGIVTLHDVTEDDTGNPCLVMEFVEGSTLEHLAESSRLPLGRCLELVGEVAAALDFAHRMDVVHRDIKPANILVTADGHAKIADFGVAKIQGARLTQTGQLVGTPAFMSPEQFKGAEIDGRSDLFSLGSVLYWLCTGAKPFPGESLTTIAYKVVQTAHVPARQLNVALPLEVDLIIDRCLAKHPEDRYPTARALVEDIEAFRAGRPLDPDTVAFGQEE